MTIGYSIKGKDSDGDSIVGVCADPDETALILDDLVVKLPMTQVVIFDNFKDYQSSKVAVIAANAQAKLDKALSQMTESELAALPSDAIAVAQADAVLSQQDQVQQGKGG